MHFRLLVPAFTWTLLMALIILRVYREESTETFVGISQSTLFQLVLFLGFAHIWKGVLMKQLKFRELKERSDLLVLLAGVLLSVFFEFLRWKTGLTDQFNFINACLNVVGVLAGLGVFRLVYR